MTTATSTATAQIILSRFECDVLRDEIDSILESLSGGLGWLEDNRELIEWALPVLDAIGWEVGRISSAEIEVPREPFMRFLGRAHQRAVEYAESFSSRIATVREGDPGWRMPGQTIEQAVAEEEGQWRQAKAELAAIESMLAMVAA